MINLFNWILKVKKHYIYKNQFFIEKIPGEIITFKSQTKDHINIIKPEIIRPPLMLNTQIMDIKINGKNLKQTKNLDMCKIWKNLFQCV